MAISSCDDFALRSVFESRLDAVESLREKNLSLLVLLKIILINENYTKNKFLMLFNSHKGLDIAYALSRLSDALT